MQRSGTRSQRGSRLTASDDLGRFTVSVDEEQLTSDFFNGDYLNYQINVLQDDDLAMWNTTAHLIKDGVWRAPEDAVVGDPVTEVAVDLGTSTITFTDSLGQSETNELPVFPDVAEDAVLPHTS